MFPIVKRFNDEDVTFYHEEDGTVWMTATEAGLRAGYGRPRGEPNGPQDPKKASKTVRNKINENPDLYEGLVKYVTFRSQPHGGTTDTPVSKPQTHLLVEERALYLLMAGANTKEGKVFQRWLVDTIKDICLEKKVLINAEAFRQHMEAYQSVLDVLESQGAALKLAASMSGKYLNQWKQQKPALEAIETRLASFPLFSDIEDPVPDGVDENGNPFFEE